MDDAALPAVSFVGPNLCDDMHGIAASSPYAKVYADCVTGPTGSAAWSSLATMATIPGLNGRGLVFVWPLPCRSAWPSR